MDQLGFPRVTQYYREKAIDRAILLIQGNSIPSIAKLKVTGNNVFNKNMKNVVKYYNKIIKKLDPKSRQKDIRLLETERDSISQALNNPSDARIQVLKNLENDFVAKGLYFPDVDEEDDEPTHIDGSPIETHGTKLNTNLYNKETDATVAAEPSAESLNEATSPTNMMVFKNGVDTALALDSTAPAMATKVLQKEDSPSVSATEAQAPEPEAVPATKSDLPQCQQSVVPDDNQTAENQPSGEQPQEPEILPQTLVGNSTALEEPAENIKDAIDRKKNQPSTSTDVHEQTSEAENETNLDLSDPSAERNSSSPDTAEEEATTSWVPRYPNLLLQILLEELEEQALKAAQENHAAETDVNGPAPATLWGILASDEPSGTAVTLTESPKTPPRTSPSITPVAARSPVVPTSISSPDDLSLMKKATARLASLSPESLKEVVCSQEGDDSFNSFDSPMTNKSATPLSGRSTAATTPEKYAFKSTDGMEELVSDNDDLTDFHQSAEASLARAIDDHFKHEATTTVPTSKLHDILESFKPLEVSTMANESNILKEESITLQATTDNTAIEDALTETQAHPTDLSEPSSTTTAQQEQEYDDYEPPKWSLGTICGCALAVTIPIAIAYPTMALLGVYALVRIARNRCDK